MYVAKNSGKNQYHLFNTEEETASKTKQRQIDEVSVALSNDEFVLHYQPKVNMRTGQVIGVEALIRWQHPERGLIPPLDFLPAIEGQNISLEIGEWVIDTALGQIGQWQSQLLDLPVSVNISAYHLTQRNFTDRLRTLLQAHPKVQPHNLELEILEHSALGDLNQVTKIMKACSQIGVAFAIDDFGTGFSSLTYLRHLPAQMIKIDQSFVQNMLKNEDDAVIIKAVITLSKAFGRGVIAEGVESVAHGEALMKLGCELAQGYGIARPMPGDALIEWLSRWKNHQTWQSFAQA